MSFFSENRIRPRLAYDGLMGQEPPLKRLRTLLGVDPSVGELGYGVGAALGFAGTGADPFPFSAYGGAFPDASLLGCLRAGLDEQMLAAPGLSASLGSLGSLGLSSSAASFIERNLPQLDPHQVMSHMNLGVLQGHPLAAVAGIQLPGFTLPAHSRSKTKLCKHFIEGNCKFNGNCSFAHSIEELKKIPGDGDLEGKTLLEKYRAKVDAEKHFMGLGQDAGMAELKTKLCKHFIEGECRFKEGCHFAHSIEELKKLPEEGDDAGKALLELYKSKAEVLNLAVNGQLAQVPVVTEPPVSSIAKTKLCRHFLSGNCKYKESCNFAHSIEELKNLPGEGDVEGKALLEQYRSKMNVEKPSSGPELVQTNETMKSDAPAKAEAESTSSDAKHIQKLVQEPSGNASAEAKGDDKPIRLLKTKMCKHFLIGACKYNEICTFAHSIEELKPPAEINDVATITTPAASTTSSSKKTSTALASTDQQATLPAQSAQQSEGKQTEVSVKEAQNKDDKHDKQGLQKTKPCRFFSDGTCRFGHACSFLHGNEQMHVINNNGGPSQSGVLQGPADIKPTYKTRLCNMWEKDKACTFGNKCHFAHGIEEMRQRAGPSISGANSLMYGSLEMEALSRARQLGFPTALPYTYEVTDTNWRPFRIAEEAWSGLGGGFGGMNERLVDVGASEAMHLRGLLQNYGQLDQASSLASLSSLGGANLGLTSNVFANLPAWQTR